MFAAEWRMGAGAEPALALRRGVRVEGEGALEAEEFDALDEYAAHVYVYDPHSGDSIATGRLYPDNGDLVLGKITVSPAYSAPLYGDLVLRMLLFRAQQLPAGRIRAQVRPEQIPMLPPFGFVCDGEEPWVRRDDVVWDSPCKHLT